MIVLGLLSPILNPGYRIVRVSVRHSSPDVLPTILEFGEPTGVVGLENLTVSVHAQQHVFISKCFFIFRNSV